MPPVYTQVPDQCEELAQCLPALVLPGREVCPGLCPACPEPEKGSFDWGVELFALLPWEAFSSCLAAVRGWLWRRLFGARAVEAAAAPLAITFCPEEAGSDRRFPRGRGRVVTG